MRNAYEVQLVSVFDGRTVASPQVMTMESDALAEYLTKCLESGYEAVVDLPYPGAGDGEGAIARTEEERLCNLGHDKYVAELAQTLSAL